MELIKDLTPYLLLIAGMIVSFTSIIVITDLIPEFVGKSFWFIPIPFFLGLCAFFMVIFLYIGIPFLLLNHLGAV